MKTPKEIRLRNTLYRLENKDKIAKQKQEYQLKNNDWQRQRCKEWREKNKAWVKFYDHIRDTYGVNISRDMFKDCLGYEEMLNVFLSKKDKKCFYNPIKCRKKR